MARVSPEPNTGCWLWLGGTVHFDYGRAYLPGGKPVLAHRAMLIAHGVELGEGDCVLHRCDVPSCVNPDHLFVGSQLDNIADMARKKRHQAAYAIPPEERERIRREFGHMRSVDLAAQYGVNRKTIDNIRNNLSWRKNP